MISKKDMKASKFMSLVLRHKPQEIGLKLNQYGYISVKDLINGMNNKGYDVTKEDIERIVEDDDKQRYSFSSDKFNIRANQGHSINVNLELEEKEPPVVLYHGTSTRFLENILDKGITKQKRQYVHLSDNIETATKVGKRHGELVILEIMAEKMYKQGNKFYLSKNGVWLTNFVPIKFVNILGE